MTLMIRRQALEEVGGFDPLIPLEDLLIELKITHAGYTIDATAARAIASTRPTLYKNQPLHDPEHPQDLRVVQRSSSLRSGRHNFLNSMFPRLPTVTAHWRGRSSQADSVEVLGSRSCVGWCGCTQAAAQLIVLTGHCVHRNGPGPQPPRQQTTWSSLPAQPDD